MEDFFDRARTGISKTIETIGKKSSEVVAIAQCKSAMNVASSNLEKNYAEIGRYIYRAYKDGNEFDEFLNDKCQRVDELTEEMEELREKMSELKNKKECPACHEECSYNAMYCSKFGHQFYQADDESTREDNEQ